MQIEEPLVAIEKRLWTNDAVVYKDGLAEEAILIFPETGALNRDVARPGDKAWAFGSATL